MARSLSELVAEIVLAQAQRRDFDPEEITRLSIQTAQAFKIIQEVERGGDFTSESVQKLMQPQPIVNEEVSVNEDDELKKKIKNASGSIGDTFITCLECGAAFKQLTYKHLQMHKLTPQAYRLKYGFNKRQPLAARVISEERAELVRKSGLVEKMQAGRRSRVSLAESTLTST